MRHKLIVSISVLLLAACAAPAPAATATPPPTVRSSVEVDGETADSDFDPMLVIDIEESYFQSPRSESDSDDFVAFLERYSNAEQGLGPIDLLLEEINAKFRENALVSQIKKVDFQNFEGIQSDYLFIEILDYFVVGQSQWIVFPSPFDPKTGLFLTLQESNADPSLPEVSKWKVSGKWFVGEGAFGGSVRTLTPNFGAFLNDGFGELTDNVETVIAIADQMISEKITAEAFSILSELPLDQVFERLISGQSGYPKDFTDIKKHELALEIAHHINENIVADEVYVPLFFEEVGNIRVGWNPEIERWVSDHNTDNSSIDFAGASFPPLVIPGYTNTENREVYIDPESGEEVVVPAIDLPGLGEVSLTDLYTMDRIELEEYVTALILGANKIDTNAKNYFNRQFKQLVLPVIILENARENESIYQNLWSVTTSYSQVPEAGYSFLDQKTNNVLVPILDKKTNQVLSWISVQQGVQWGHTRVFILSSGGQLNFNYPTSYSIFVNNHPQFNDQIFGFDPNHSFGILLPGLTTEITYGEIGDLSLLEDGIGIGSESEISSILMESINLKTFAETIEDLYIRLLVLYPYIEIHQSAK
jgi:hypothetical protein